MHRNKMAWEHRKSLGKNFMHRAGPHGNICYMAAAHMETIMNNRDWYVKWN